MLVDVCGVNPTHTTMVCVLSTSSQLGVLESGACVHGYIEKTVYMPENDLFVAGKILLQLQPASISNDLTEDYVAPSNVYASEGKWQEVESLRKEMKIKKIETEPDCGFSSNH
ncbi:hypothetical protein Q3G72_033095 [Acer saccharum]|nr:hypothetical protein Q3G72_033095 [Acer saccharum]